MVTKYKYEALKSRTLKEVFTLILESEKYPFSELRAKDLFNESCLNSKMCDLWYYDIFTRGVYLFFDTDGCIRYVGKTKTGFYGRFMSQSDTNHRKYWDWNALLRKMGAQRTGNQQMIYQLKNTKKTLKL